MLSGKDSEQSLSNGTSTGETSEDRPTPFRPIKQSMEVNKLEEEKKTSAEEFGTSSVQKQTLTFEDVSESSRAKNRPISDPVNILQFSQDSVILVTETLEDDRQSIIPPSPEALMSTPLVIPSTPTSNEGLLNIENIVEGDTGNLQEKKSLQQRITFSQESVNQTPLPTRMVLAEHVKQLVSDMQSDGGENHSKRSHQADSGLETLTIKKRRENSKDDCISQTSPIGGRTYKMLSRHDRAGSSSPRTGSSSAQAWRSDKARSRQTILLVSQEDTVQPTQERTGDNQLPVVSSGLSSTSENDEEDDSLSASWNLRLTAGESTQPAPTADQEETHCDDSLIHEEDDKFNELEELKIFRCLKPKPRDIELRQCTKIDLLDSDDQIRIYKSVKGRLHPVISSQNSQENVPEYSCSTPILSSTSSATKRAHSEEESGRQTRPKTCNTSVQTEEESSLTDHDTPNTSAEIALSKKKYHYKIKEELISYLLTCTEDGNIVKSVAFQNKTNVRMATEEEKGYLMSSLSSSNSTSQLSHMSSLTSGEMGDISSFPSSKSNSASSLHSLQQTGLLSEHMTLDHSRDSDKSSNISLEKHAPSTCVTRKKSDISSSSELSDLKGEHFTRPLIPAKAKRTPTRLLLSPSSDSSSESINLKSSGRFIKSAQETTPTRRTRAGSRATTPSRSGRSRQEDIILADETEVTGRLLHGQTSSEITLEDLNASDAECLNSRALCIGLKVMAKWRDNYFYFGQIKEGESSSVSTSKRWSVLFHDGCTRTLGEADIFPVDFISEGQSVFAVPSDSRFILEPGVVTSFYHNDKEEGFIVDLDSGISRRCPYDQVALSIDQAACITKITTHSNIGTSSVSLDNLVEGRRRRTPVKTLSKNNRKPDPNLETTASSDTDVAKTPVSSRSKGNLQEGRRNSPGRKMQSSSPSKSSKRQQTPTRASRRKSAILASARVTSKIFEDFAFLLSRAEHKPDDLKKKEKFYEQSSASELDDDENTLEPMDKEELREIIEAGGGEVLDSFESAQTMVGKKVVLVSGTHLRTFKYIKCLAAGIPCVNEQWVADCSTQKSCLEIGPYNLPAGYSITEKNLIDWHGCCTVLKDLHILLVSEDNPEFIATWKPVLLAAQANAVQQLTSSEQTEASGLFDMVVTDSSCPDRVLNLASLLKVPVVSTEWVIQCLINGCLLRANAHPKFRYDYKE